MKTKKLRNKTINPETLIKSFRRDLDKFHAMLGREQDREQRRHSYEHDPFRQAMDSVISAFRLHLDALEQVVAARAAIRHPRRTMKAVVNHLKRSKTAKKILSAVICVHRADRDRGATWPGPTIIELFTALGTPNTTGAQVGLIKSLRALEADGLICRAYFTDATRTVPTKRGQAVLKALAADR